MSLRGAAFLSMLRNYRVMWVGGRFGGGKTSFITRVGYEFVERGWANQIVANFPCVLATDIDRAGDVRDTVILADEAGLWINDKTFGKVTAFLRKFNLYLFMASVEEVPLRARALNVQRDMNWQTVGVPLWRYSIMLNYMRVKEKMSITWWRPDEIFGLYDTAYPAGDDAGIVDWVNNGLAQKIENRSSLSIREGNEGVEGFRRAADTFAAASQELENTLSVYGHKTGRRRR